jgi:cation diffusion facilitator CzcD-associated flavoprotein CzcO
MFSAPLLPEFEAEKSAAMAVIRNMGDAVAVEPSKVDGAIAEEQANARLMKQRVAIIGGGVSGVVTARILLDEGLDVKVFEQSSQLGGVWSENYVGFGIQVPANLYEFPDERLPKGSDFCSGPIIAEYIREYAQKHGVTNSVQFGVTVSKLVCIEGGYEVSYQQSGAETIEQFGLVVVATGVYGKMDKFIPDWSGRETFKDKILHASDFLDLRVSEGKKVVTVGYGKSAFDCTQISTRVAKSSTLLFREAHWCVPRKILGVVPFEFATFSRFGAACLQPMYVAAGPFEKILHAIPYFLIAFWQLVAMIFAWQFGLAPRKEGDVDLRPNRGFIEDFWCGHGILPHPDFFPSIRRGDIDAVKGEISEVRAHSVVLKSGQELPCDLLIAATGYSPVRSFLPAEVAQKKEKDGLWLYRNMIDPDHPRLVFLNSETTTFTNITTASIQARWLAELLAGRHSLPSDDEMKIDIEQMQAWKRNEMPNAGAARAYMIQTHQVHYYDQLLKDMGASIRRKRGFLPLRILREIFEPYRPRDYETIVTGQFKRHKREEVKPGSAQGPFAFEAAWFAILVLGTYWLAGFVHRALTQF